MIAMLIVVILEARDRAIHRFWTLLPPNRASWHYAVPPQFSDIIAMLVQLDGQNVAVSCDSAPRAAKKTTVFLDPYL